MVEAQLEDLRDRYPAATVHAVSGGAELVRVPGFPTAPGWSRDTTEVRFLAPAGFPYAQPDCFWADADLRLAGGAMPQASNITPIADTGEQGLWFSWHLVQPWNPSRDSLLTWLAVIAQRFRAAQ